MTTTTPAERLRAAATRLRDTASEATPSADPLPGGWMGFGYDGDFHGRTMLFGGPAEYGYRTGTIFSHDPQDCEGSCSGASDADVQYISTVHPAVGLALAEMLDRAAGEFLGGWTDSPVAEAALAVADAVLGAPVEVAS